MLGGVCGGLAEYFVIDPTLVRLVAVALTLAWGTGILAYLIFWFAVPQRPLELTISDGKTERTQADNDVDSADSESSNAALFIGIALVVIGFLVLLGNFISLAWLSMSKLWPLALIALGVIIIVKRSGKKSEN
jgi:phage shock protein C